MALCEDSSMLFQTALLLNLLYLVFMEIVLCSLTSFQLEINKALYIYRYLIVLASNTKIHYLLELPFKMIDCTQ